MERAENRRGRPTRLTARVADEIVIAVEQGATLTQAARVAGVGLRTVHDWIERGRAEPYGQLLARIECAQPKPAQFLAAVLAQFAAVSRPLDEQLADLVD